MVSPEQIAKLLTEDPDVFNEMAAGTGGVAGGVGGGWGPGPYTTPPTKKRSKKRRKRVTGEDDNEITHKKYYADPVTGQAKVKGNKEDDSGEVLYSDTKSDDPEETIDEATDNKLTHLINTKIDLPSLDKWTAGTELNDSLRKNIRTKLKLAYSTLFKMIGALDSGCPIDDEWEEHFAYIKHLQLPEKQQLIDDIDWDKNPVSMPPAGWWGSTYGTGRQRGYIATFWYEICYSYFKALQTLYRNHTSSCNDAECEFSNHKRYLVQALCSDQVGFSEIWDQHRRARKKSFERFVWFRRREQTPIPDKPLSARDQEGLEKWRKMSDADKFKSNVFDILPDSTAQLSTWYKDYPKARQNVFSSGFSEPAIAKGTTVFHHEHGKGRVVFTPDAFDIYVRVLFDKDQTEALKGLGSTAGHGVKSRRVLKSELEIDG